MMRGSIGSMERNKKIDGGGSRKFHTRESNHMLCSWEVRVEPKLEGRLRQARATSRGIYIGGNIVERGRGEENEYIDA
jgi:hypothetical protein